MSFLVVSVVHLRLLSLPCSIIFCEAVAIYGVIVAIILQTKVEAVKPNEDGSYSLAAAAAGYAVLGAGSVTGWANLACG